MGGLVSYGAYVPYHRLERGRIAGVLGSGGGRGTRAVAGYDEDTTSMAVEAGRAALSGRPVPARSGSAAAAVLRHRRARLPDKTNATAVHAALRLPSRCARRGHGRGGTLGVGALIAAAQSPVPTMAVLSDIRTGLPGSADERDGGDGAAAFVFGGDEPPTACPALAEIVAQARRPPSSSTGGGRRARPPRGCGRNGSASTSTCRLPTRRSPTR